MEQPRPETTPVGPIARRLAERDLPPTLREAGVPEPVEKPAPPKLTA